MMKTFAQLKKSLKKDFSGLKTLKVALLGDSTISLMSQALKATGYDYNLNLHILEADFNQIERQIFDNNSELYSHKPDVIVIFQSSHKLLSKYNKSSVEDYSHLAINELELIKNLYSNIENRLRTHVIFYNYAEINDAVFGNFANKHEASFLFQLRKLNYELMVFASKHSNFHLCDLSSLQNQFGKSTLFHPSIYINTEMVLSLDVLPEVASRTLDIISAISGKFKKCIILDLDNTLWGGIIGDDGVEKIQIGSFGIGKAFTEFQYWIKKLKNRGIIIAVCSKNTESIAKEPFEKHPDMVLHLEDISVFIANWDNKADNIRHIQSILNIGFDSMVFIDDNPFERNLVKENIPELTVPELPEDPSEYLEYLYSLNLFETISFSKEDLERTSLYQIEAKRNLLKQSITNEEDFLKSLNMISLVESFNNYNIPRVAQLSQRSNQFNLRTVRYSEENLTTISHDPIYSTFSFNLDDKFGSNGIICAVILKKENNTTAFIETWFMSCRVLKRGMEAFVLNTIVNDAKNKGFSHLKGEFIPTAKNEMVKNHYLELGFEPAGEYWLLNINTYQQAKTYIKTKQ